MQDVVLKASGNTECGNIEINIENIETPKKLVRFINLMENNLFSKRKLNFLRCSRFLHCLQMNIKGVIFFDKEN